MENGISSLQKVESASLQLGGGLVKDLKIGDDNEVFVLWESNREEIYRTIDCTTLAHMVADNTSLLNIGYRENSEAHSNHLRYGPHASGSHPVILSDDEVLRRFSRHGVGSDAAFVPEKLEIQERKARRQEANSWRILLLSKDKLRYRVLELTGRDASISGVAADADDVSMV